MRILLYLSGIVFVVVGLGFLVGDIFLTDEAGVEFHSLGWWWSEIHRESLLLLQPAVERHLTPALWDPGLQTLLEWPAAPQFLIPGAVLWFVGSKKRPTPSPIYFQR